MAAAFIALRKKALRKMRLATEENERHSQRMANGVQQAAAAGSLGTPTTLPPPDSTRAPENGVAAEPTYTLPKQRTIYRFYAHWAVQFTVALVILANFLITICEKEFDPYPTDSPEKLYQETWVACDVAFNLLFLFELLVNLYGSWFFFFWRNPWNQFDFVVVLVGILSIANALDGPLEDLKMLRAFRVFRLFKRIKSLNKIVTALVRSIPGVFNAFLIMLIVMCIYAILAVEYFRPFGEDGTYTNLQNVTVDSYTPRAIRHGEEYYGTFSRALYTLFQVLTGESWAEAIARPLLFGYNPTNAFGTAFFFTSFILLTQIVLVNVVVAVLLDKFVESAPEKDEATESVTLHREVSNLQEDVSKIRSQLDEVLALKGQLDKVLTALDSQYHA